MRLGSQLLCTQYCRTVFVGGYQPDASVWQAETHQYQEVGEDACYVPAVETELSCETNKKQDIPPTYESRGRQI